MGNYPLRVREASALAREATVAARWFYEPQLVKQSRGGVGVSTPRGAVSNQEISVFVAGLLKLSRYGKPSYPEMRPYPPRERRQLHVGPRGNSPRAQPP